MAQRRHPEFIDSFESTKYPFVPTATLSNGTDSYLEGTFLDAHLYATAGSDRYYISSVTNTASSITILIGDSTSTDRLTGTVNLPISESSVRLIDNNGRPGGVLISEPSRLAVLSAWGIGEHKFTRKQTEFCVTCQVPSANLGVTGISATGGVVSGKVWLLGEDGVVLSSEQKINSEGKTIELIRVDVVGDPQFLQRLCESDNLFEPVRPIKTIRVCDNTGFCYDCTPDEQGNFNLQMNDSLAADTALRIRTTPEGIVVLVEGSTPEQAG